MLFQRLVNRTHTHTQTRLQGGRQLYEAVLMNKAIRVKNLSNNKKRSEQNVFQIFLCLFLLFFLLLFHLFR